MACGRVLCALVLALGLAAPALAGTPHTITGLTPPEARYIESTAMPLPENIAIRHDPCPAFPTKSCAYLSLALAYIHPDHMVDPMVHRIVLGHELGHHFEVQFMAPREQAEYAEIVGQWDREGFATNYSYCTLDPSLNPALAPRPRPWRWRRVWRSWRVRQSVRFVAILPRPVHLRVCQSLLGWWIEV